MGAKGLILLREKVIFYDFLKVAQISIPIFPGREFHSISRQIFYYCANFRRNISFGVLFMNIYRYKGDGLSWIYVRVRCWRCGIRVKLTCRISALIFLTTFSMNKIKIIYKLTFNLFFLLFQESFPPHTVVSVPHTRLACWSFSRFCFSYIL